MKKFVKGSIITALIMLILGIITVIVCAIWGSHRIAKELTNSTLPLRINDWIDEFKEHEDIKWNLNISNVESSVLYNDNYTIHTGDISDSQAAHIDDVDNIAISMDGGELLIRPSDGDYFELEAYHCKNLQYYIEDDTFYLLNSLDTLKNVACEITLKVPAHQYDDITISVGAGNLEYDILAADTATVTLGAGAITIDHLETDTLTADIGIGALCVSDASTEDCTLHVGIGSIDFDGIIDGDLTSTCSTGCIDLNLEDNFKDHNYFMTCSLGNIDLDHSSYSGHINKNIDNDADSDYQLNCSLGEIILNFNN